MSYYLHDPEFYQNLTNWDINCRYCELNKTKTIGSASISPCHKLDISKGRSQNRTQAAALQSELIPTGGELRRTSLVTTTTLLAGASGSTAELDSQAPAAAAYTAPDSSYNSTSVPTTVTSGPPETKVDHHGPGPQTTEQRTNFTAPFCIFS